MLTLAFDLGDFNRQSAWHSFDDQTRKECIGEVITHKKDLTDLMSKVKPDRILCEACTMSQLLHDSAQEAAPEASFVAASTNGEAWQWSKTKKKTDATDAHRLIRLDRLNDLESVYIPKGDEQILRRLLTVRNRLVDKRTACYNAIRHAAKMVSIILPTGEAAWTKEAIASFRKQHKIITSKKTSFTLDEDVWKFEVACHLDLVKRLSQEIQRIDNSLGRYRRKQAAVERLTSTSGVGTITACALLAFIGDPTRFKNGKKVAAYFGMVPRTYQSGDCVRSGRITKRGNRLMRRLLIQAAWAAVRKDGWAKDLLKRLAPSNSPGKRKIAIVAIARRMLIRMWAMMRDQTTWAPPEQTTA